MNRMLRDIKHKWLNYWLRERQTLIEPMTFAQLKAKLPLSSDYFSLLFVDREYPTLILNEQVVLSMLAKGRERLFEFGTYEGFGTWHLWRNSLFEAWVHTLNLPREQSKLSHQDIFNIPPMANFIPVSIRVEQLIGDSTTENLSRFYGKMDLVFVDGGHTKECIESDTANAFKMVKPDGVVVWHDFDCKNKPISSTLFNLAKTNKLYWITHTSMVVYFGESR